MANPNHDVDGHFSGFDRIAGGKGVGSFQLHPGTKWRGMTFPSARAAGKRNPKDKTGVSYGKNRPPCGRVARKEGKNVRCWDGADLSKARGGARTEAYSPEEVSLLGRPIFEAASPIDWQRVDDGIWAAPTDVGYTMLVMDESDDAESGDLPYGWYVYTEGNEEDPEYFGTSETAEVAKSMAAMAVEDMLARYAYVADPSPMESLADLLAPIFEGAN